VARKRRKPLPKAKPAKKKKRVATPKATKKRKAVRVVRKATKRRKAAKRKAAKPVKRKPSKPAPKPVKRKSAKPAPKPARKPAKPAPKLKAAKRKAVAPLPAPKPVRKRKVVTPPAPKPVRKKRDRAAKVNYIHIGDFNDYSTATHLSTDANKEHYKNFSHLTRSDPKPGDRQTATITAVFEAALEGHLGKVGIEYDDVRIFGYGALFRPDGMEITQSLISEIAIILSRYRVSIIIADEAKTGQNAIMLNFGNESKSVHPDMVVDKLNMLGTALQHVYELLSDELDCEVDWDVWWDTDEVWY
jgi:hypothetical protein